MGVEVGWHAGRTKNSQKVSPSYYPPSTTRCLCLLVSGLVVGKNNSNYNYVANVGRGVCCCLCLLVSGLVVGKNNSNYNYVAMLAEVFVAAFASSSVG